MTWPERFAQARSRQRTIHFLWWQWKLGSPYFTREEKELARDWNTCAVGETIVVRGHQFERTPAINGNGLVPKDKTLTSLGLSFYEAIRHNQVAYAEQCYNNIVAYAQRVAPLTTPSAFADQLLHEAHTAVASKEAMRP